jgi:hypothetical protein
MDYIKLEARRSRWGPYDVVPQQDRGQQTPPACNDELSAGGSKPQMNLSHNSISRSILAEAEPQESTFKLPPRSYSRTPTSKRLWKHVATGTAVLLLVMIPIGILLLVVYASDASSFDQQGFTYCNSDGLLPLPMTCLRMPFPRSSILT